MKGRETGSVFIESVISAAIVAMAMGATLNVVADSAARERKAEAHRTALLIARSELADVGGEIPLAAGETSGVAGDLIWRVQVSPYGGEGEASAAGALYRVSVSVRERAGGPDLAALDTLRLGSAS
jgi:hypothetical protein